MRGLPIAVLLLAVLSLALLPSTAGATVVFDVSDPGDDPDATPGDGLCSTTGDQCTLRAAIQESNALPGPQLIHVPEGEYTVSELDISGAVGITGAGQNATVLKGGYSYHLFHVTAGANAAISGLTARDVFNSGGGLDGSCGG